jgi:hypothetical protein
MKNHVVSFGLFLLLLSGSASAGWSSTASVRINKIEVVLISGATATLLGFSTMPDGRPSCAGSSYGRVHGSVEHKNAITDIATAAYLGGKAVKVYWNGQCTTGGHAEITRIMVQ